LASKKFPEKFSLELLIFGNVKFEEKLHKRQCFLMKKIITLIKFLLLIKTAQKNILKANQQ
jgi:hypothetical protein